MIIEGNKEISENTKVSASFKIIATIVTSIIMMTWIVSQKLNAMDAQWTTVNSKLNSMDAFWTVRDMEKWADEERRNNPAVKFPFVSDILAARVRK